MDIERAVISKIVVEQDILPLLEARVTSSFFADEESRAVFQGILDHWGTYGSVFSREAFEGEYPKYKLLKVQDPYKYYIDELRSSRKYALVVDTLEGASELLAEKDTDGAVHRLGSGIEKVVQVVSALKDVNLVDTWEARVAAYQELRKLPGGLRGIPTGFPTLDQALSGLQKEQLITFIGQAKSGKSTMLMKMAIAAHEYGKSPLFIGFEMSNTEQEARHDAMRAGIDHHHLTTGRMSSQEEAKLTTALGRIKNMEPFYLSTDASSTTTVGGIAAKVKQLAPDVVFVDGVYLMDDDTGNDQGSPQALTAITRAFKRLAQNAKVPIVITTQALSWKVNRKQGLTADSIGWSSSFAQDSDAVLGVEQTDADDIVRVRLIIARNAPSSSVLVRWDWSTGQFEELFEDSEEADDDEDYLD